MSMKKVVASVTFACTGCTSNQLTALGAVKTEDGKVYIMYQCDGCGEPVPIEMDGVMINLFQKPMNLPRAM